MLLSLKPTEVILGNLTPYLLKSPSFESDNKKLEEIVILYIEIDLFFFQRISVVGVRSSGDFVRDVIEYGGFSNERCV